MNKNIHRTYLDTVRIIKLHLQAQPHICLVLDKGTHFQNNFIGIVAITMEKCPLLTIQIPESLSRSAIDLKYVLSEKIEEFEIEGKIVCGVTHSAAVMQKTLQLSDISWSPCSCHLLNSAVKDMTKKSKSFKVYIYVPNTSKKVLNLNNSYQYLTKEREKKFAYSQKSDGFQFIKHFKVLLILKLKLKTFNE
jgi:hypothetical protein